MSETLELRDAGDIARWLAAGLAMRRVLPVEAGRDDDERVARAIVACANELSALPPPGVIADLSSLLAGAPFTAAPFAASDDAVRGAVRAYDDDVLARLIATPRFDDVVAAYAHADERDRGGATALVVAAVCERAGFAGIAVSPATLRRALARPISAGDIAESTSGTIDDAVEAALPHAQLREALADAYQRLARGARHSRALVDDREVFAVDHLAVLRDHGARMTAAHLGAAATAIAGRLPRRLPTRRDLRGLRDTQLADDSTFPAGGFSSITPGGATTGNIENLVTSELVYMEDDPEGGSIDLFSLRYVEGELLHYTRDDSVFRRHRHIIAVALDRGLDALRIKDRDLPWQRLILVLGWLVAAIRWLTEQLGDQALTVRLAFPPHLLGEERQILALLLEGEIARGSVEIVEQTADDAAAMIAGVATTAIADLVVIGAAPASLPRGVRALHVDVATSAPVISELAPRPSAPRPASHDAWLAWCDAAEDVLRWLV